MGLPTPCSECARTSMLVDGHAAKFRNRAASSKRSVECSRPGRRCSPPPSWLSRERADEFSRRVVEAEAARAVAENTRLAARDLLEKTLTELESLEIRRGEIGQEVDSARARGRVTCATHSRAAKALAQCAENLMLAESAAPTPRGEGAGGRGRATRSYA